MASTLKQHNSEKGLLSRLFSADHRHIGSCYMGFAIIAGLVGALFSLILRFELDGYSAHILNGLLSVIQTGADKSLLLSMLSIGHALIMIFFMMIPALIGGFANWMVPYLIGSEDVAFPKLNRFAFWLLVPALFLLVGSIFFEPSQQFFMVMASIHISVVSLLMSFINFIATIVTMRKPEMSLIKMPIFVWSVLVASFLGLMCLPILLATTLMPAVVAQSSVENFSAENLPVLVWFLMHPESYVLLLPAFGIISQIIATFACRPLFAERGVIVAMLIIGFSGFIIWAENVFALSNSADIIKYFTYALPLIGLPICFILLSWVVTLCSARLKFETPLLWAIGGVAITLFGALSAIHLFISGFMFSATLESTFVGHFHYVVSLSVVFAIFAGWYYWFPKISGFTIRRLTGSIHFFMMFVAVNMIFLPQYLGHSANVGKNASQLVETFSNWNIISIAGVWLAILSLVVFIYGIVETFIRKQKASNNPWGEGATTLEWQLSSPPLHA